MSTKASLQRLAALLCCAVLLHLTGCGSGSNRNVTRTSRVQIRIAWPAKSQRSASGRYLPSYAASIFFEIFPKNAPETRYTLIVNRPSDKPSSQTVTFSQVLNEGDYVLAASARVDPDGQGATVASASVPVAVKQGMNAVDLGLSTTIKTISILGQPLSATIGTDVTLQSGAFDPDGRTLLLPSDALTWSIVSGSQFGTLSPTGLLSPKAAGTMHVRLAETGAGITSEADITITSQVMTAALGTTPYPKENVDLLNTGLVAGHGSTGHMAWTYDLGASTGFYATTPILGANGLVYGMSIASSSASPVAIAIHASDGTKAWQATLNAFTPFSPVVLSTNLVCIPANNAGLIALDANTGVERWRNTTVQSVGAGTVDRTGHLLIAARDGVHVLDPSNGNDLGTYPGMNASLPAVGQDGTVYYIRQTGASSANGELVAVNPATKMPIWTAAEIETGHTPVIGPNGRVYTIGSQNGTAFTRLVAFDGATGMLKSEIRNQFFNFSEDPVFGSDGLLYIGQSNKITSYSLDLMQVRQSDAIMGSNGEFFSTRRITIGSDGVLYVVADQNSPDSPSKLLAFNSADLTVRWTYDFTGRVLGNIAVDSDGTVYFLTDTGKVTALR